jgi:hypothetical protein
MEPLVHGLPGPHECWRELAEHSLTHDDLPRPREGAVIAVMPGQLALLVPTRGRPRQAAKLALQIRDTATPGFTVPYFLLDHDDPELESYLYLFHQVTWPDLMIMITSPGGPRRMGPVLNRGARLLAGSVTWLGFMGDDHWPRTPGWDTALAGALGGRPGIAYGNDLFQAERLPTACVMTADIVRVLGYMSPPPLEHLWIDDFWRTLGLALGNLAYLPHVLIEHRHPAAGKAEMDAGYAGAGCSVTQMTDDKARWDSWRSGDWEDTDAGPGDRTRLIGALALQGAP